MKPTDVRNPDYFHKVVDCQWACPAHTNVPEYIRMVAQGRYDDAYLLNRDSNVFPGILGRTCDRPCEPACRRTRVEEKPVAICRIKRVAADLKGDVSARLPKAPATKNGKRVACIGAGPASLTVANDLMPLGYEVVVFEKNTRPGGLMRTNVPSFRLPAARARRRDRHDRRHGRGGPLRHAGAEPEGAARARASTPSSSARARRGARISICRGARKRPSGSTSASTGWRASPSITSARSASASSSSASATPRWTAAARRGAWAARTSR